jgi:hypothetical protein
MEASIQFHPSDDELVEYENEFSGECWEGPLIIVSAVSTASSHYDLSNIHDILY